MNISNKLAPFALIKFINKYDDLLLDFFWTCENRVAGQANMSAHELARVSYSYPGRVFDRLSVPIGVDVALNVDSES